MHITLWQQFSSNHSTSYVVVGVFPTPDYAEAAYVKLRAILLIIADDKGGRQNEQRMTAAEIQLARQYNIDWQEGLDWLHTMQPDPKPRALPYSVDDAITIFERLVFVGAPGGFTNQTGHQFAKLIQVFQGMPYFSVMDGDAPDGSRTFAVLDLKFECRVPNTETGTEIARILTEYMQAGRRDRDKMPIPWAAYHPRLRNIAPDLTSATYAEAERRWLHGESSPEIVSLRSNVMFNDDAGTCTIEAERLNLKVRVDDNDGGLATVSLLLWLQGLGCSDFQYELDEWF